MSIRPQPGTRLNSPGLLNVRSGGALTAWANSWLRGAASFDAVVAAVRDAGISAVRGLPDHLEPVPVGWVLSALRASGGTPLRLVLPVPGDTRGVPEIPGLPAAATRAGQLVVGATLALLPDGDPSAEGRWLAWALTDPAPISAGPREQQTVAQAAGALRLAVLEATDTLADLDVARWSPGIESLWRREHAVSLPPDHQPSAAALASQAARLAAVLELAGQDAPGGAVNGHGAVHREAALRPLSIAVREALMTAFTAIPVPRNAGQ